MAKTLVYSGGGGVLDLPLDFFGLVISPSVTCCQGSIMKIAMKPFSFFINFLCVHDSLDDMMGIRSKANS